MKEVKSNDYKKSKKKSKIKLINFILKLINYFYIFFTYWT